MFHKFSWISQNTVYIHGEDIIGFSFDLNWLEEQIWTANLLEVSFEKVAKKCKEFQAKFGHHRVLKQVNLLSQ